MPGVDIGDPVTAWQSRRRRTLFELPIEHCFWATGHGEPIGEDHDRSSGSIHVNRARARFADPDWLTLGLAVGKRAGRVADTDSGATSFTGSTSRITGCESVVRAL